MARVTAPPLVQDLNAEVAAISREYLLAKRAEADAVGQSKRLRDTLVNLIEQVGEKDTDGHYHFRLPEAINGVYGLQRQRRVSRSLDEVTALAIISEVGLEENLLKTVTVVDEDAIMAALVEGVLTEEDVDRMFPVKVTYALTSEKK